LSLGRKTDYRVDLLARNAVAIALEVNQGGGGYPLGPLPRTPRLATGSV